MIKAIAIDDEPLALRVIQSLCARSGEVDLQKTFTKPTEALKHLKKFPVDLLFCDIHMPAMTGLRLAASLPQNTLVIFTTAYREYAAASYELKAIDYLLKPINQNRFSQAIHKAQEYLTYISNNGQNTENTIFIRADFCLVKIPLADILYIEGLADYLKIHIKDRKTVVARMPMKEIMDRLPAADFIRVHRSYILPFRRIEAVRGNKIYVGEMEFPIGKTYTDDFFTRYAP